MTKEDALKLLSTAKSDSVASHVNRGLTHKQVLDLVKSGVECLPDGASLTALIEKRVWQCVKDQRNPRY